jgi:cytoskeletal protein CcmA (bactofilin family)
MFNRQRETAFGQAIKGGDRSGRELQARPQAAGVSQLHSAEIHQFSAGLPSVANGSVIGRDLTILGSNINIISREALQIDGEVRGNVSGKRISIGAGGTVDGSITAETVEIDGRVDGSVKAVAITLNPSAKVSGDLLHRILVIAEGAEFEGNVRRSANEAELKPDLTAPHQAISGPAPTEMLATTEWQETPREPIAFPAPGALQLGDERQGD